jgi:hypothetical protein
MKKNIGTKDRLIRLFFAILCFVGVLLLNDTRLQIALVIFGVFNVFQAIFSWCALYAFLGRSTCPIE